jgi:ribonuclease HI
MRQQLCDILGVASTPDLGKYLGFPLRLNGRNARDFRFIVDKVQSKLSSWKSKLLSPAGRVVLIQAVTSSIPAYYMQNAALPSSICSELDKLNRDFLWGSNEEKKKMHMVGWDKICRPKKDGGLGLYSAKPRNIALLAKLNWRLVEEKDSLWAKTLLAKYCPNGPLDINERTSRSGSSNWRGLKMGHEIFRKGIRWVVRNGHSVSFWHDNWVGNKPLREVIQGPIPPLEECFCVVDVIEGVGFWDFSKISFNLPDNIRDAIRAVNVCSLSNQEDSIAWDSSDGGFSLGQAYQLARKQQNVVNRPNNSMWLWKVKTSPRILFFLWQCYHDSVPVRDTLASRGLNITSSCPRCLGQNETLIHLLRDCPDSVAFWHTIKIPPPCVNAFSSSCADWLLANCSSTVLHADSIPWQTVFAFGVWTLWIRRNQMVFKAGSTLPDPVVCVFSHAAEFFSLMDIKQSSKNLVPILIKWIPPPVNWAKLNTDGSVMGESGLAGGGGVIRNYLGNWVGGFSRSIGITTSVQAELRALKDGLQLALDLEIPNLEIEMDSTVAVKLLHSTNSPNAFLSSIVNDCRYLLERFEAYTLKHIYREANGCADLLAKAGCDQHSDFLVYTSAPAHVLEALDFDISVATRTRLVSA